MEELMEALRRATNVASCAYDTESGKWIISYKNGIISDEVQPDDLVDFLSNV